MSPTPRLALFAFAVATSGCLMRAAKDEPPLVGAVKLQGGGGLDEDDVTKKLALTESGREFGFTIGKRHPFDADIIKADSARIERVYASHGFFLTHVNDVKLVEDAGRMNVTFVVDEGKPAPVRTLSVAGLDAVPVRADVLENLPLRQGARFDEEDYDDTKSAIRDRLRNRGYVEAEVKGRVVVDRTIPACEVYFDVTPGRLYTFGRVVVFGAQNVSRDRLVDATGIVQGQVATPAALARAQQSIYAMGVFGAVQVDQGPLDREGGTVPVRVSVSEAPFMTVEAGGGLEIDPTRWVTRGRTLFTHRNLDRGLQRITLGGSLGWAFVPSIPALITGTSQNNGLVADLAAEYAQPKLFRLPFDGFVRGVYEKEVALAFSYQKLGFRPGIVWQAPFLPQFTVAPSLSLEWFFDMARAGSSGAGSLAQSGCGELTTTNDAGATIPATRCLIFYSELRFLLDLRNDTLSATKGLYASLNLQAAGTPISDFAYLRILPEVRGYWPLTKSLTGALKLRYGYLDRIGSVGPYPPGVVNFFAGGATSVRTASVQQLGPREFDVVANPDARQKPTIPFVASPPRPVGGDRLIEGSLELRWKTGLWGGLALGLFFDAGALEGRPAASLAGDSRALLPTTYQYGPGIGIRYHTPFGPLRLDFAWRMTETNETPIGVKVPGGSGLPTDPSTYSIKASCPTVAADTFNCWDDVYFSGLQFFITLGEAF